jgi:hypothetical protein
MRRIGISACVASLCTLTGLAIGSPQSHGDETVPAAMVREYSTSQESWQAILLRNDSATQQTVRRHILMVDTSASQVGYIREIQLKLVEELANLLPANSAVQLVAIDSLYQPLTDGFVSPVSAEFAHGRRRLRTRTPLGATNIRNAVQEIVQASGGEATSVLWIGDGISSLHPLSADEISSLTASLNDSLISLHSIVLGPDTNPTLPATFANLTGGVTHLDAGSVVAAKTIAASLRTRGVQIQSVSADGVELATANSTTWLRPDRHTVLFRRGAIDNSIRSIAVTLDNGATVKWDSPVCTTVGAEVRQFVEAVAKTNGLVTPIASVAMYDAATREFNEFIDKSARVASRLDRLGHARQSRQVAMHASALDSGNERVKTLLTSLQDENPFLGTESADDSFQESDVQTGSLADVEAMIKIRTQKLQQATDTIIDEARVYTADQPEYAESLLKDLLATIRATNEVAADARLELESRVIGAIATVQNRRDQIEQIRERRAVGRAVEEAQANLLAQQDLKEKELQTLIDSVRGLLVRAREGDIEAYEDAEAAARVAIELEPGNGPATQALMVAEAAGQLDKARRLRELRADRFLEALYQVELSHVPFPDEPPVQYPPTDVWRALTLTRVPKYSALSLQSQSKTEEWLNRMLSEPIPLLDYPQDTPVIEILEFLSTYYTDTWGAVGGGTGSDYRMSIWTDKVMLDDEGIESLSEITTTGDIYLQGQTLRTALRLIFSKTEPVLAYIIQDDVLKITSDELANSDEYLDTRIYPVGDLVIDPTPPQGAGGGGIGGGGIGGGGIGGGGFGGGGFGGGGGGFGGGGGQFSVPPSWEALLNADDAGITTDGLKKKQGR